ncbi:winged helix-turn-helix domain-containing protein [Rheinheimera baltica]|uniref:winged helix-turn-helix domain-containing protein n=1 Tax=Rheinheimera baltica TaxID=67576 RepID=UPI00273EC6D3|nr:winged helix-turn-helix domain-containing protein [Rheinheimera baltica]MDP5190106.1 winged helix-turn-helix domain-containing protein [Rheinheimera baltica]
MTLATNTAHTKTWQLGNIVYVAASRQLQCSGQQLYLEPRQHKLLLVLLHNALQVVSREQLIDTVWDGRIVSEGAINRAISMLRKALSSLDPQTEYIETLPKLGYRLRQQATVITLVPETSQPTVSKSSTPKLWLGSTLLATALCGMAIWFIITQASPQLSASGATPHTSFKGRESQLSSNSEANALLYQRTADNGNNQIWLNTLDDNQHQILTDDATDSRYAVLSPDAKAFAFVTYTENSCKIMLQPISQTTEPGLQRELHQCPIDNIPMLSWRADGKVLYLRQRADKTQPYQLYQLVVATGKLRQLTLLPANYSGQGDTALAASTTSGSMALLRYLSPDNTELLLVDSNNGQIKTSQSLPINATALTWYNDNILLLSAGKTVYQYHIDRAQLIPLYQAADPIDSLTVLGNTLYYSSTEVHADIWQADSTGAISERINSSRLDTMPRLSHDGTQLAFLSTRQGHYQLWLQQANGALRLLTELPGQPGFIRHEWSPDDKKLLFSKDGAAYQVDVASGALHTLLPGEKQVMVANWGEDINSLIYSSQRDGDWQLWLHDIANGNEHKITERGGYSGRIWHGQLYFSKYHHDGLWFKDLRTGNEELLLAQFDKINWLNWQLDDGLLHYYQPDKGIYQLDLTTGDSKLLVSEPSQFVRHFSVRQGLAVFGRHSDVQGDIYRLPLTLVYKKPLQ